VFDDEGVGHSDLRPGNIHREIEASLRRLGTDYVDLYQFHWPDNETGTPVEESWSAMLSLRERGKVRCVGVSNFDVPLLERCEALGHVDSLQPPYSLLRPEVGEEILPWCLRNGTGVIVYSPMQAGLLSGKFDFSRVAEDDWRRRNPYFQEPQLSRNLAFAEALRPIAARHGKTVGNLAVAWTLANPAVTSAIVGARNPAQVEENVQAMGWRLTDAEMGEIAAARRECCGF
jgi:aryl-alcohol dehydrogenase-like predicted oxidoreductase